MQLLNSSESFKNISSIIRPFYSDIIIGVIILLCGLVVGKVVSRVLFKVFSEIELNKLFKLATGFSVRLDNILSKIAAYFIYFVFGMWALETVGLSAIIINIIASAIIILFIIAIILGIKDFIPNIIAGFFIHFKGVLKEGNKVEIDNIKGTVKEVGLVETKLSTTSKDTVYVPNSAFIRSKTIKVKNK
ncbi:MAG: mechanosensitive ion channel domain-containing protein [Nanobdellota archaeon]